MFGVIDTQDYQITGPRLEPIDLEEVKKQRRFSSTSLDTLFDMWIGAARQDFETQTGLSLLTTIREFALDAVPCDNRIELPRPPLQGIVSIGWTDGDGVEQTMDSGGYYMLPRRSEGDEFETFPTPGDVALVSGASWPSVASRRQALRIRYTCGFGDAPGSVPELIVYALNLFVGSAHKFSEQMQDGKSIQQLPYGAESVMMRAKWNARRILVPKYVYGTEPTWQG